MNDDFLKSAWEGITPPTDNSNNIRSVVQKNGSSVLMTIRRQMIFEIAAFTVFLIVYYDFFDGNTKPASTNIVLVLAVLFIIISSVIGYRLASQPFTGNDIRQSLQQRLEKIRVFAIASVTSRVLAAACLLVFFSTVIRFTSHKYILLALVIAVFMVQAILLSLLWKKRISQLKQSLDSFAS